MFAEPSREALDLAAKARLVAHLVAAVGAEAVLPFSLLKLDFQSADTLT
jgi:hypothetical protein